MIVQRLLDCFADTIVQVIDSWTSFHLEAFLKVVGLSLKHGGAQHVRNKDDFSRWCRTEAA